MKKMNSSYPVRRQFYDRFFLNENFQIFCDVYSIPYIHHTLYPPRLFYYHWLNHVISSKAM